MITRRAEQLKMQKARKGRERSQRGNMNCARTNATCPSMRTWGGREEGRREGTKERRNEGTKKTTAPSGLGMPLN